ncbi:hypothetical protein [Microbacterium marinilacus]|uniref:SseB protein N-terminal domain-containing protein n=1 Tax=Microbacterium marinilacus TaxID=415209 RepID=A0ABP7BXP8_9MICO|nr:hypothetical protein [Microbacterium marinilacus]MBY0688171.1 hypothetical protein [Microbacterium marinilacus]
MSHPTDPDPRLLAELDRLDAERTAAPSQDAEIAFWKAAAKLGTWFFVNRGTDESPRPYALQLDGVGPVVSAYSSAGRAREAAVELGLVGDGDAVPLFALPMPGALDWVSSLSAAGVGGVAINHPRIGAWIPLPNLAILKSWTAEEPPPPAP